MNKPPLGPIAVRMIEQPLAPFAVAGSLGG